MKKFQKLYLIALFAACTVTLAISSAQAEQSVVDKLSADTVNLIYSDFGANMDLMAGQLGGSIIGIEKNLASSKVWASQNSGVLVLPAWRSGAKNFNFCYIDLQNAGQFGVLIESYFGKNILESYLKIYLPSGKIMTFKNFKMSIENSMNGFQDNDDVNNLVHIQSDYCTIMLILGLIVFWPLLIFWAIDCL